MFCWPWARNREISGAGKHAVPVVPVVPDRVPFDLPNWDLSLDDWESPTGPRKVIEPHEHVRFVVASLQEAGMTGYVPGYYIHRVYPEWAWIANCEPLTRRQLDIALSAALPKAKRRTPNGALLAHYLIPENGSPGEEKLEPVPEHPPERRSKIVAFASTLRSPRDLGTRRAGAQKRSVRKGEVKAAA